MKILRPIAAVLLGLFIGSMLNGSLIAISSYIIPPPAGSDLSTAEGLSAAMPLMGPQHFLFPFLAHALGTLIGALITARIANAHQMTLAMLIGIVFLAGGIYMVAILPAPMWFNVTDLLLAYIPMAWLGGKLGSKKKGA